MASRAPKVLVYGDLNMDLILEVPEIQLRDLFYPARRAEAHHGGVGGNVAEALAALGARVTLVARVGEDCFGRELVQRLEGLGVDVGLVESVRGGSTGVVVALVMSGGRRTLTGARNSNALNNLTPEEARRIVGETAPDHVHVSGYTVYNTRGVDSIKALLRAAKESGASTSIDLEGIAMHNPRLAGELRGWVDVALMNEDELTLLTGGGGGGVEDRLRRVWETLGPSWAVVKMGERGAAGLEDGVFVEAPALPVEAVDTTGAGDAFNAGLIVGFLAKTGLPEALELANLMGGYAASRRGARVGSPPKTELLEFYRRHRGRKPPEALRRVLSG